MDLKFANGLEEFLPTRQNSEPSSAHNTCSAATPTNTHLQKLCSKPCYKCLTNLKELPLQMLLAVSGVREKAAGLALNDMNDLAREDQMPQNPEEKSIYE